MKSLIIEFLYFLFLFLLFSLFKPLLWTIRPCLFTYVDLCCYKICVCNMHDIFENDHLMKPVTFTFRMSILMLVYCMNLYMHCRDIQSWVYNVYNQNQSELLREAAKKKLKLMETYLKYKVCRFIILYCWG